MAEKSCSLTEFVGTAIGDTLGLVIANVDTALLDAMKLEKRYRSIGILGARTGAGPHIMAADEAVKATNTEVVSIELPRDTKGGAGHGSLIILGGNDVSDVKRGIEVALKELDRTFGDVYGNEAGHIELQYTARASYALEKAFGAPIGRACGIIVGAPASVGVARPRKMVPSTRKMSTMEGIMPASTRNTSARLSSPRASGGKAGRSFGRTIDISRMKGRIEAQ